VYIQRKSVNSAVKLFEICIRGYIMVVHKGYGPCGLRAQEEKEV
jgi:hypothetical protein